MSLKRWALIALWSCQPLLALTWLPDLDEGLKLAKEQEKPLLAYFGGAWCIWCQRLEQNFLSHPVFEQSADSFVLVRLDYPQNSQRHTPKQIEWKRTYQVSAYPTLLLLSSQGELLGRTGYPRDSVEEFVARVRQIAKLPPSWQAPSSTAEPDGSAAPTPR